MHRVHKGILVILIFLKFFIITPSPMVAQVHDMQSIETIIDLTLENNRQITILEKQIESAKGDIIVNQSPFDPVFFFHASKDQHYIPKTLDRRLNSATNNISPYTKANLLGYALGYRQKFRFGTVITPNISFTNYGKDSLYYSFFSDELNKLYTNRTNVDFRVTQPLLLGFGRNYNTYQERLAQHQYKITKLEHIVEISFALKESINKYLSYTSAVIDLQIQVEMEQWMNNLKEQVGYMVEMDALPESDLKYVKALIASQMAHKEEAKLKVMESKNELGKKIGLSNDRIMEIPKPLNSFQIKEVQVLDTANYIKTCIRNSQELRKDIEMFSGYVKLAELSVNQAKKSSKQELNLTFGIGYNGIFESSSTIEQLYQPYLQNIYGLNYHVGLSIGINPSNSRAKGDLIKSLAAKDIADARVEYILSQSANDISNCFYRILSFNKIAHNLHIATELHREALDNEYIKLKLGTSTIINLTQVQINYFELLLDYYNAIYNLNSNIVNLRYLTGSLVSLIDDTFIEVNTNKLFSMPFIN